MRFKDLPIKRKLMSLVLLTSTVVLLLMCTAYVAFEYFTFKKTIKNNLETLGTVIASNSSAALAFESYNDAAEILKALDGNQHIIAAALYDSQGKLFAKYPASMPNSSLPEILNEKGYYFGDSYLEGFLPVKQKNFFLGTLYLKSDLNAMYNQMEVIGLITLFLMASTLLIAYLLSNYLQKSVSKPILELEKTTKQIAQQKNFSLRAVRRGNDEIGELTDAFNQMLAQIEAQNQEIKIANEESLKLAAIVESSSDAIIGSSLDIVITSWNKSAERIFGYKAMEMIGQRLSKIFPPVLENEVYLALNKVEEGKQIESIEAQALSRTQKVLDISLTISPVKDAEGKITGISHIARDISEQKKNELLIKENEEHLRLATQAAELGTFDWDIPRKSIVWDKRCRELFGLTEDEPLHYKDSLLDGLHEGDRERVSKVLATAFDKSLGNGSYDVEYRTVSPTKQIKWIRAKGKVFFNNEGDPLRFIGTALDITDKKQEELRKNDFIAIISHELKTPLTTIKSYVQILLSKAKKDGDEFAVNALTRTDTQAKKMVSMIKDFLQLARIEEGKIQVVKEDFDLHALLEDIVNEAHLLTSSHRIQLHDCENVKIHADRDKIGQVMINLVSNAIKYSTPDTTIKIGCEKEGKRIKVYVKDEGVGISQSDQKNLFTRFYRVKNEKVKMVSGFGVGLYIVSEILKYHDSRIRIESKEDEGSTFYFYMNINN